MAYQKALVCFANSVKTGGFCVAGKEIGSDAPGRWIRPVSGRPKGEVAANEYIYADNRIPHLLDIIEVGFSAPNPHAHQTENHVIDGTRWRKTGILAYARLATMIDQRPSLWGAGEQTYGGINDCVSPELAGQYDHSLLLIKPADLIIHVGIEGYMYQKRVVRAHFIYHGTHYALAVTDPVADAAFKLKKDGQYPLDAYLCVSLTEPYEKDNRCHKLAAAIISNNPF
jgi:hypothetical protein